MITWDITQRSCKGTLGIFLAREGTECWENVNTCITAFKRELSKMWIGEWSWMPEFGTPLHFIACQGIEGEGEWAVCMVRYNLSFHWPLIPPTPWFICCPSHDPSLMLRFTWKTWDAKTENRLARTTHPNIYCKINKIPTTHHPWSTKTRNKQR